MSDSILAKGTMQSVGLVLFFVLCQIIGTMCTVQNLSWADDVAQPAEDMSGMVCPMDGTIMCPPSAISSPERQLKRAPAIDLDQVPILPSTITILTTASTPTPWSWSTVLSIVPISVASSSVLRI